MKSMYNALAPSDLYSFLACFIQSNHVSSKVFLCGHFGGITPLLLTISSIDASLAQIGAACVVWLVNH